jgi:GTP:adenosylcobinamide-phosphate guanylyltransferase/tRNA A-37 threonylcarbamoyl transferase component Bud32
MEPARKSEMIAALETINFKGKTVFAFGHCNATEEMIDHLETLSVHAVAILDNNKAKYGSMYKGIPITPPAHILEFANTDSIVLIANRFCEQMRENLRKLGYKGEVAKILEYNSFAEYSLSDETFKRKTERMLRGMNTLKKIRESYQNQHLIVCPHDALGDVYWAMSFLPTYAVKHGIGEAVIIVNGERCRQVAEIFGRVNVSLSNGEMEEFTQAVIFNREQNCIIAHHDKIYTDNAIKYLNNHSISFTDYYRHIVFGLDKSAEPVLPTCNLPFENTSGILQGKTLIISPYAKSVVQMPDEYWQNVIHKYKSKGFTVCTNITEGEEPLENTLPISFPLNQAVGAVEFAGHFIGIRSGLCDVINSAVCNKTVVFPDCIYSTTKMKVSEFFALPDWNKPDYIVVQAGGKGVRLEYLTANKPKALVAVENLPMLFHLFKKYPDKKFIIIADHKKDILREYLECFAQVKYLIVEAVGTGTCSGIRQAMEFLPDNVSFMLIWSDLILPADFELPTGNSDYIGISQTFPCRWSFENGMFEEKRSEEFGVAGLFVFKDKSRLADVPESGELVKWFRDKNLKFKSLGLAGTREFGTIDEYKKLGVEKCRPFNKMTIENDVITKEAIDQQGKKLAELEKKWYEFAIQNSIDAIPKICQTQPLKMERINGKNIYEYGSLSKNEKTEILKNIIDALKNLHKTKQIPPDLFSVKEAYYGKTMNRLCKVRDLIPFAENKSVIVNGHECRNVFFYKRELEKALDLLKCERFSFIHGDCTFSNIMLKDSATPVFIDPRGYFGSTELFGDPNYDWAKLYYSIAGNYDRFNLKDFRLKIDENSVELKIESNNWEELEKEFFEFSGADEKSVKLLHAVIWLSLTTYAWQDYDSICGAFYNGIYYLEEALK